MAESASLTALLGQFLDLKTGQLTKAAQYLLQQWQVQLAAGFDSKGNLISNIDPSVEIIGRPGTIGAILQYINQNGIVLPTGLSPATSAAQGAVILPAGAVGNTLGSAAMQPVSAFDPDGAAAAAQTAAETFASTAAASAQANAETYASDASNLTTGTVSAARLPGISVTVSTAALTPTGTQGSMTFTNGLLTTATAAT